LASQFRLEVQMVTEVTPPSAQHRSIYGEDQGAVTSGASSLREVCSQGAVLENIRLKPQRPVGTEATSSSGTVAIMLKHITVPAAPAARAVASSPSTCSNL
jgi:hypothetical protein